VPSGAEAPALRPGVFEGISDEHLEAELRAAGLLVSGSGGHGNRGPDASGGGGGDGEGWDDEEWPHRRHSRTVRVMALATASLLVLGTAGAWISLAVDASRPAFPASVVVVGEHVPTSANAVAVRSSNAPAPARTRYKLALTVTNRSGVRATPECVVLVDAGGHQADGLVVLRAVANGGTEGRTVLLTVPGASAVAVPEVGVACGAR
jgi:hypothetical protein